jgi:hypothetical protein
MAKERESTQRQCRALQELLTEKNVNVRLSDFTTINGRLFTSMTRQYFDRQAGPYGIHARFDGGAMHLPQDAIMFPFANTADRDMKTQIATHVLDAQIDGQWLVDRGASVLLGPGTTVFHVAWELASRLRRSIEDDSDSVFGSHPFLADWHSDSFEIARLLGPLATRGWAPNVYWMGYLVSRKNVDLTTIGMLMEQQRRKPGTISTLILGCEEIDRDGAIYTKLTDHVKQIENYIEEAMNTVVVVGRSNKLSAQGGAKGRKVEYSIGKRDFYLVTETEPKPLNGGKKPPKGFRRLIWPEGEWK